MAATRGREPDSSLRKKTLQRKRSRHPPQVCPVDGKKFRPVRKGTIYCSKSCRNKAAYEQRIIRLNSRAELSTGRDSSKSENSGFQSETPPVTRRKPRIGKAIAALVPWSDEPVEGWTEMVLDYDPSGDHSSAGAAAKHVHVFAPEDSDMVALGNAVAEHKGISEGHFEVCNG